MKNRELFLEDPTTSALLNNGVAEVHGMEDARELDTLRYELKTFVCEGQYAAGLRRILYSYVQNFDRPEQPAVWVSGFYGSGKSHLVKVLGALWTDFEFPDDRATARGIADLPTEVADLLRELSTLGRRAGAGLRTAAGTLSGGAGGPRPALLEIVFKSRGLPAKYPIARFVLWLKREGIHDRVKGYVESRGKSFEEELKNLYVSPALAEALLEAVPSFAPSPAEARSLVKNQFPMVDDVSLSEMVDAMNEALSVGGRFPCTLIVLDELQQFIGDDSRRASDVQVITETCAKKFGGKLLFVATGQSALTGTPNLQKIQGRFPVTVQLTNRDVETVIRKVVLAKKPDKLSAVRDVLTTCSGEISRHLIGSKLEPRPEDRDTEVADYPLLPVRNRFWEHLLGVVDKAGKAGQLRNQLKVTFEAVKATADQPLGTVVPADFIYDQTSNDLMSAQVLPAEIFDLIAAQKNVEPHGELRARLCALVFLVGKLRDEYRDNRIDLGVRADAETLADLLVEDLPRGSAGLRALIPGLLAELADAGRIMAVENGYRIQTRESSAWESAYRERLNALLADEGKIAAQRENVFRTEFDAHLKGFKIVQGRSKEARKFDVFFGQQSPDPKARTLPIWVRDGWNEDESAALADIRRAGTDAATVFVFVPRRNADELKKGLASLAAADETLNSRGVPATPAGTEARTAMETRRKHAEQIVRDVTAKIFEDARVYLGGGGEYSGMVLSRRIGDAAQDALKRLYPRFEASDDHRWTKVLERARKSNTAPLEAIDFGGDVEKHPVCAEILKHAGPGRKGSEFRQVFRDAPYGWPQDAVDAALAALTATGKVKALLNGKPVEVKDLDQQKIGVAEFRGELVTLTVTQRLGARKLLQDVLGANAVKPNEEAAALPRFFETLFELAERAGGPPPLPAKPDLALLHRLNALIGNEQLVALYEARETLEQIALAWRTAAEHIAERRPRWDRFERLRAHAVGLPIRETLDPQVEAMRMERSLLANPDPLPRLNAELVQALRDELNALHGAHLRVRRAEIERLEQSETWRNLPARERDELLNRFELADAPTVKTGTDADVLDALDALPLDVRRTRTDALPKRFENALLEAARRLEPKAVQVKLPGATLRTESDLDGWLDDVRARILDNLKDGPVIV